jgi:hypothetical protein
VPDEVEWDNAPGEPLQSDGDGVPDILDADDDGDGLDTLREQQELSPDGDGVPNFLDADSDNDGRPDSVELDADDDDDAIPNFVDADDTDGRDGDGDLDGLSNGDERTLGTDPIDPDTDHDLQLDGWEVTGTPAHRDTDLDGTPDALDDDDDGDGALSWDESGLAADTELESLCDECTVCAVAFVGLDPDPVLSCDGVIGAMPPRSSLRDSDQDGVADALDDDDDDDGRPTARRAALGTPTATASTTPTTPMPTDGPNGDHDTDGLGSNGASATLGHRPVPATTRIGDSRRRRRRVRPRRHGRRRPPRPARPRRRRRRRAHPRTKAPTTPMGTGFPTTSIRRLRRRRAGRTRDEAPGDADCDGLPDRYDAVVGACSVVVPEVTPPPEPSPPPPAFCGVAAAPAPGALWWLAVPLWVRARRRPIGI